MWKSLSSLHRTDAQGPQTCLASTQALQSRRVSSASKSPNYVVAHRSDRCSSLVRPVPIGQTGQTHRSDRSGAAAPSSSVLRSWLCWSTMEPNGFLVNHQKPCELGVASANRHSWLSSHVVPTRLWFWGSTKKPSMTHLVVFATMRRALYSAGHRVPQTKPTYLLHTWRPHRQWPFALVLHLHQHQSSRNLHLQYLAKNQSTQRCQSLITPGSDHPPVLESHMVLNYWQGLTGCAINRCCDFHWFCLLYHIIKM
jgi:hypothetical protein